MSSGKTLLLTAGAVTAGTVAYAFIARPWLIQWGITDEEASQALPGDELVPHPVPVYVDHPRNDGVAGLKRPSQEPSGSLGVSVLTEQELQGMAC